MKVFVGYKTVTDGDLHGKCLTIVSLPLSESSITLKFIPHRSMSLYHINHYIISHVPVENV